MPVVELGGPPRRHLARVRVATNLEHQVDVGPRVLTSGRSRPDQGGTHDVVVIMSSRHEVIAQPFALGRCEHASEPMAIPQGRG
ncbi:hypothetical protein [Salana multivorans]